MSEFEFTSESVSEGHPDKVCDQISDAILDFLLKKDPKARSAVEVLATTNKVVVAGEVGGNFVFSKNEIDQIVRNVVKNIGYDERHFNWQTLDCEILLHQQSADISMGLDQENEEDQGAGDQGIMFGYACRETDVLMPAPIHYAHLLLEELAKVRKSGEVDFLGPDAKSQITFHYEDKKPKSIKAIVLSTQHTEQISQPDLRHFITDFIYKTLPTELLDPKNVKLMINPTGQFIIGGPHGDTGLTGRKIIVDTYGGAAPHGGGAFSGKDASKVDRSAAYMARYIAKNIVSAGLADRCMLQLSYAIGMKDPVSFFINCKQTNKVDEAKILSVIKDIFDLTPYGIRRFLGLNQPIYQKTASYGHFGRPPGDDGSFAWERTDLKDVLLAEFEGTYDAQRHATG
jgi:S-adenosylmethionine synthetase